MVHQCGEESLQLQQDRLFNFTPGPLCLHVLIVTLVGYDPAEVTQVESGSTVAEAGLQEGDIIKEYQGYHIDLARDLYLYMYLNNPQEDETIHMTVERNGKDVELAFKPDVQVRYLLGFNQERVTDSLEVASLIPGMAYLKLVWSLGT